MVAEKTVRGKRTSAKSTGKIPEYLICEIMDGQPLYYKGYKDVLKKKRKGEDIMGSSSLQAILVAFLMEIIIEGKLKRKYEVLISEAGIHLNKNNNLAGDILIYDPAVLTPDRINKHYADVPPKMVIEVDIMIELENQNDYQYVKRKVDKLHQFGTEKVVWIMTATKQVIVAVPDRPWQTYNWDNDIELIDNVSFNIGNYLQTKGIVVEE
jgi:Uma2 family endonuclease